MNQLNVQEKFSVIRQKYQDDAQREYFNLLLCGEMGTGKTHILKTARKPVLLHNFDPGGEKTLRDQIKSKEIIVQNFAPDDPFKPWAFYEWTKVMADLQRSGLMEHFGTYALDSSTMWAEAIMNYIVAKRGQAGKVPAWQTDYMPQKIEIRNWLGVILGFPCDVIVTGHLEPTKDEVKGIITYRYATTGKGSIIIPAQFDEVYVALSEESSKGINYRVQTAGAGRYAARSRLASGGKLDQYEDPDIKKILKKVGFPTEDKPLFT